jgi:hypothetical protein
MAGVDIAGLLLGLASVIVLAGIMSAAPAAFGAMFRPPIDEAWPIGVQEDDDLRWSWRADARSAEPAPAESDSDGTYAVQPEPVHPRLIAR